MNVCPYCRQVTPMKKVHSISSLKYKGFDVTLRKVNTKCLICSKTFSFSEDLSKNKETFKETKEIVDSIQESYSHIVRCEEWRGKS